jgi:hypothetical protein
MPAVKPFRFAAVVSALAVAALALTAFGADLTPAKRNHWAWKSPVRPTPPTVQQSAWVQNPIDAFILAKLEAAGLPPAPPANREQLLRRATFDLVGLPPTPAEIDAFVNDRSPDAWERVLDRLLASPHYGERWGRHWLDLARFAETNGYEHDEVRPDAWRYRDYVIGALNDDKPYDRFVKEQLAGDELFPDAPAALVATGFNLLGADMTDAADALRRRHNTLDDMTDTAGLVFLGLTVGCARCHDHKFEPISQGDYFRLQAFFAPAVFRRDVPLLTPDQRQAHEQAQREFAALVQPVQKAIADLETPYRQKLRDGLLAKLSDEARLAHRTPAGQRTAAQEALVANTERLLVVGPKALKELLSAAEHARLKDLQKQLKALESKKPALPVAMALQDGANVPKTFVLKRGELGHPAEEVQPGWPLILSPNLAAKPAPVVAPRPGTTGRRTALANWLTRPDHPLTARVMVNRLWQHHFGRGLVATASDFGLRGQRPTHPELLDWLASEFVARGWSVKHMHRLMLSSATYRQATTVTPAARSKDPDNELFSRMNRQRLEGEVIRDSLLAVSGRLNRTMGGPGVFPLVPAEALQGVKGWTASPDPRDHVRRSVYIFARRNLRFPFLEAFDLPDSNLSCPKRERSTTAPQALTLLNAADVLEAARALAARLTQAAASDEERVTQAFRLTLGRRPTETELRLAREFLQRSPLTELCRALFNVNEFVYLD